MTNDDAAAKLEFIEIYKSNFAPGMDTDLIPIDPTLTGDVIAFMEYNKPAFGVFYQSDCAFSDKDDHYCKFRHISVSTEQLSIWCWVCKTRLDILDFVPKSFVKLLATEGNREGDPEGDISSEKTVTREISSTVSDDSSLERPSEQESSSNSKLRYSLDTCLFDDLETYSQFRKILLEYNPQDIVDYVRNHNYIFYSESPEMPDKVYRYSSGKYVLSCLGEVYTDFINVYTSIIAKHTKYYHENYNKQLMPNYTKVVDKICNEQSIFTPLLVESIRKNTSLPHPFSNEMFFENLQYNDNRSKIIKLEDLYIIYTDWRSGKAFIDEPFRNQEELKVNTEKYIKKYISKTDSEYKKRNVDGKSQMCWTKLSFTRRFIYDLKEYYLENIKLSDALKYLF
jgi:hypothetical protein